MVKRDTTFVRLFWLKRCGGVFLLLCEPVLIALLLWFWPTSTLLEKGALLFLIVWGFPLAFAGLRVPRQRLRVEALRMRLDEAPLLEKQPACENTEFSVPVTLTMTLAPRVGSTFALFWLAIPAIFLCFQAAYFPQGQVFWWLAGWILLGALVLNLVVLAFYQRIEITDKALMVQRGWRRRRIAWPEARLFALVSLDEKRNSATGQYELSSSQTILRWTFSLGGAAFVLQPRDRKEYGRLLEEILVYIRAKTGLMIRDLR